jgi:hypothetical protein
MASFNSIVITIATIIIAIIIIGFVFRYVTAKELPGFQKIVLTAAIIILIIALIIIGILLSYYKAKEQWPPIVAGCPDYWTIDGSSNLSRCTNIQDLGSCQPQSGHKHLVMDFSGPAFSGANGTCAKYAWAKKCNVTWDGITYGVNNPCSSS